MTTPPEQQIRAVIDERVAAVRAKDAGPLAACEAEDVVSFDVLPPLNARGKDAVAEKTIDGDWRIVHDHESVPWDPETGQGLIDLSPA